jgi:hypothetical protein
MTLMRHLVIITISWAVFLSVPLINAQDVRLPGVRSINPAYPVLRELPLQPQPLLSAALRAEPVSAPLPGTPDLSRYRGFALEMNLQVAAKEADLELSDARLIHQRPAVIQELDWRPSVSSVAALQADPVKEVLLTFYNGALFRMVVNYDRYRTEGLTDADMVEAISARYGTASRPDTKVILFSTYQVYDDSEKVIARWENSQYSYNLFRSSYQPTFGMLIFSKRLDALAQTAIAEALRLDEQEAPQRQIELQRKLDEATRATQEKARLANKPNFRP